ncbi:MAG: 3-deoxy-D-manno-octulosonic acid transferase, partial [Alphaproteobacteria bacterium]
MSLINGRTANGAYRIATRAIRPVVPLILRYRLRRGKEDPDRLGERYGIASRPRPAGPLIRVHAASVGETNAVLPLIGHLIAAGEHILLTTGTVTSAKIAAKATAEFPDTCLIHQFAPMDIPAFVDRFLDHWQ